MVRNIFQIHGVQITGNALASEQIESSHFFTHALRQ